MMDVPECNVCHVELDEDDHQPRHLGCSHDACLTCIKTLIKDGKLECPMCRTILKAYSPDDFQINHGVVQVLRLFKSLKIQMGEKLNEEGAIANLREMCGIHDQVVSTRCLTCTLWICIKCKGLHTKDIGCETLEYEAFLKKAKEDHKDKVDPAIVYFKRNLYTLSTEFSDLENKRKAIDEQMEKLKISMEEGADTLNKFIAASSNVDKATTSTELDKSLHTSNEWYKYTEIWWKNFTGTSSNLNKEMESNGETYASLDICGKSSISKLTFTDGRMFLHCFRIAGSTDTNKSFKILPYEQAQKWLPQIHDKVFLDLAISGSVKGRVIIRIRHNFPSYAKNIPLLFTGEEGEDCSLLGLNMLDHNKNNLGFAVSSKTKSMNTKFTRDTKAGHEVVQGSVLACWSANEISRLYIYLEDGSKQPYDSGYDVLGVVESGMAIVKLCRKHSNQSQVTVSDCGILFEEDDLAKNIYTNSVR